MGDTDKSLALVDAPHKEASTDRILALVLSGDPPAPLNRMTPLRSGVALPFAGRYRLIDVALATCIHSGIRHIGVITQRRRRSPDVHRDHDYPSSLRHREASVTLLRTRGTRSGAGPYPSMGWHAGSADVVYQHRAFIAAHRADEVLILSGSEIFCTDLSALIAQHRQGKADLTIAAVAVQGQRANYGTLVVDAEGHVRALVSPGSATPGPLAIMGAMLFSADVLSRRLSEDAQQPNSTHELIADVLPRMIAAGDRVMAFQHNGYWRSVDTAQDYWQAHMEMLGEGPGRAIYCSAWPLRRRSSSPPPTRISASARVSDSMVSEGCIIEGLVEHSVLSPGVHVAPGAVIRHAVVMVGATIEERAVVENAILGIDVIVGARAHVGHVYRHAPTCHTPVPDQLVVAEAGKRISARATVEPGILGSDVLNSDLSVSSSSSGEWFPSAQRQDVSRDVLFWTD